MDNKKKAIILIAVGVVISALLYFIILHPYVQAMHTINASYKEFHVEGLGNPANEFTKYEISDSSFVPVEANDYTISLPTYFTDNTKDDSEFFIFNAENNANDYGESISFGNGIDYSDMAILNQKDLSDRDKEKLIEGYEKLGYGIPDTCYSSLKCSYLITEDDFSFWNREKMDAYTLLVPYRTGGAFFYSDGNSKTYIYETEETYALISEQYILDWNLYHYVVNFFDSDDLNTQYTISMKTKTPETAYAIINSIEFKD